MSGGHFDYRQDMVSDLACEIDDIINNESNNFSPDTLDKLQETRDTLRRASKMVQRIDWFVSGDDGEESFHCRWKEDGLG